MEPPKKKKPLNKWIQLINIPIQMGIVIFLFSWIGQKVEESYGETHIQFQKWITLLGVFIALYNVYRQVQQLNDSE
jgi:hypothetical protein